MLQAKRISDWPSGLLGSIPSKFQISSFSDSRVNDLPEKNFDGPARRNDAYSGAGFELINIHLDGNIPLKFQPSNTSGSRVSSLPVKNFGGLLHGYRAGKIAHFEDGGPYVHVD